MKIIMKNCVFTLLIVKENKKAKFRAVFFFFALTFGRQFLYNLLSDDLSRTSSSCLNQVKGFFRLNFIIHHLFTSMHKCSIRVSTISPHTWFKGKMASKTDDSNKINDLITFLHAMSHFDGIEKCMCRISAVNINLNAFFTLL